MLLTVEGVSKQYKNNSQFVLENISFSIEEKDFFVITGASGSGKSTLLAILGGYQRPTAGTVKLQDKDIFAIKDSELSKLHGSVLAYVPQSNIMLKRYTVLQNVMLPYQFSSVKIEKNEVEEKARIHLKALGIDVLSDRYPYELSGGELKRASLARAMLYEPELIIADEPTSGLDAKNAEIISNYLYEYSKNGKTVAVATHDELVKSYGNRKIELGV
jgi:ABC-type lipoprotein export system ATPase subunit